MAKRTLDSTGILPAAGRAERAKRSRVESVRPRLAPCPSPFLLVWHVRFERYRGKQRTGTQYWPTAIVIPHPASYMRPHDLCFEYMTQTLRVVKLKDGMFNGVLWEETAPTSWEWTAPDASAGEQDNLRLSAGPPPLNPEEVFAIAAGHPGTPWISGADQATVDQCSALFSLLLREVGEVVDGAC